MNNFFSLFLILLEKRATFFILSWQELSEVFKLFSIKKKKTQ